MGIGKTQGNSKADPQKQSLKLVKSCGVTTQHGCII